MLLKLAWRNIWRNRRRSLITAASVAFALLFAILMRSLQLGTYDHAYQGIINATTGYVQIHDDEYWEQQNLENSLVLADSLLEPLQKFESLKGFTPRLESFSLLSGPSGETHGGLVRGIIPGREAHYFDLAEKLSEGSYLDSNDRSVLLGKDLAEKLKVGAGDTIVAIGQGFRGMSANGKFPVKGILDLRNPEMNKRAVIMALPEAQQLTGAYNRATALVLVPHETDNLPALREELHRVLPGDQYGVMTWREMIPEMVQAIEADSAGGLVILFILYLVIGFGIFGTVLMLSTEREPEFGILISIGMSRHRVALATFLETIFLGLLGIVSGSLLALPICWYYHLHPIELTGAMTSSMEDYGFEPLMPFSVDPQIWINHGLIVLIINTVLSVYALAKIYRINPVQAIRG